ncbi:MAG: hypothetical protein NZ853_10515 [Leptospiraceae bacterium]|nr:hypothetical protein [Leptospiraceae bacterium]MDW7977115.1 hypothetical protein [Leptospiraceae bacterium]
MDDIRELKTHKEAFLKILKEILRWEEKEINTELTKDDYKIRKLISEMPPNKLKISFLKLEEAIYYVVIRYETANGEISTSWIHEDEVFKERLIFSYDKNHLSHQVPCLTDLYQIAEPISYPFYHSEVA